MKTFDEIVAWAEDLGLETEHDESAGTDRFRKTPELLPLVLPATEVETKWLTHFEAEELLQGLESDLETQAE